MFQLFLPVYDNDVNAFPAGHFASVRDELTERFGGLTSYARAPAHGVWEEGDGVPVHDDLIVHEVMAEAFDREWWKDYRARLERQFVQGEVLIRAQLVEKL